MGDNVPDQIGRRAVYKNLIESVKSIAEKNSGKKQWSQEGWMVYGIRYLFCERPQRNLTQRKRICEWASLI